MPSYWPERRELDRLRQSYSVVPVWRELLADFETPVSAFKKLAADETQAFLLESVEHGQRWGRWSFIGLDPFLTVTSRDGELTVTPEQKRPAAKGPLEGLREIVGRFRTPEQEGLPPFFAGAVGYLGYDCVRYLEKLPATATDDLALPELMFMLPRTVFAFDHLRQKVIAVTNVIEGDDYEDAIDRTEKLVDRLGASLAYRPVEALSVEPTIPESTMSQAAFEKAVSASKEYIAAGDIFQVVLSHRFALPFEGDPFDVYRALRVVNPSPYMFFVRNEELTLAGSSPEPLVTVTGRKVVQRPIAGTRPRGASDEEDLRLEEELLADEKERAEHVMLVDLARNDVGRVAAWGSVQVDDLMKVERYSHVMHLVSQVSGTLAEGCSGLDALFASFPAGTVSGAPKIRAMEIIDELEPTKRGP
ncbi:MAG TPA: chorismate-binding protein, partial [Actinomycetota bacterium]|nr:chorismate-binding protein [Actinomycetota bacterium]